MVFAIDIGTRKVAGIIGEKSGDKIRIIDAVLLEHEKRAMLNGQIHSIEDVSKIVMKVKNILEERNGVKLDRVTTALAGRSLHTEKSEAITQKKGEITREDITFLTMESVRRASDKLAAEKKAEYYCVGYSIVQYKVDGEPMKNPVQQIAKESVCAETIVTFLPKPVFDSMSAVLKNCGLVMEAITLEPIAALYVTIPEDMRMLNLALVDVGAGTSDIAITEKGKITNYGMIPKAGDEVTEAVCAGFLADFNTAERIKRETDEFSGCDVRDIFNNPFHVSYEQLISVITPKVQEVAKEIADGILDLNGRQPQAVVMVGGGSSLKLLREQVAQNLGLPANRVGSRLPETITMLENLPVCLKGNDGITPIGILETAIFKKGIGFVDVKLNGEKEYIINLERRITVMDVLLSCGFEMKKLYGKPGDALTFTYNGEMKIIRGGRPEHAKVFINDIEKSLEDEVKQGDNIFISAAKDGTSAAGIIRDVISEGFITTVEINGKRHDIAPFIMCNGREVSMDEPLHDRCNITVTRVDGLREVLARAGYEVNAVNERDIMVTINGELKVLKQRNFQLKVNGVEAGADARLAGMDKIEFKDAPSYYRIKDVLKGSAKNIVKITVNGKPFEIEHERFSLTMNGKKVFEDEFIINGATLEVKASDEKIQLSSIFKTYQIDTRQAKGRMLQLVVNGVKAGYTTPIEDGARVEINFVESI
ncbi:MAG: hypothetical protein LLG37_10105 [Spirochaetia bacterium]|nr:hypothetical protein [Spirochaetia bacterium]